MENHSHINIQPQRNILKWGPDLGPSESGGHNVPFPATSDDSRAVPLSVAALVVHMISDRIAPLHYDIKTMYKYWGLLQYSESVGPYYNYTKLLYKTRLLYKYSNSIQILIPYINTKFPI